MSDKVKALQKHLYNMGVIPSRKMRDRQEFLDLKAWVEENCPRTIEVEWSADMLNTMQREWEQADSGMNPMSDIRTMPVWLLFADMDEALKYKLTWG